MKPLTDKQRLDSVIAFERDKWAFALSKAIDSSPKSDVCVWFDGYVHGIKRAQELMLNNKPKKA